MKRTFSFFILLLVCMFTFGQEYSRKIIDYATLNQKDSALCSENNIEKTDKVYELIESLQSEKSVVLAKELFEKSDKCPELFEAYAWALFRSGEWMRSSEIIDSAISIYGSNPNLILKRGYMNIEMAELGVGARNIDGNSVYLSKDKKLEFEESNFIKQNYLAALNDFKYLADNYQDSYKPTYITGYIYQQLEDYENSNTYLSKLLDIPDYGDNIAFVIVDNYIGQKKYDEAEKILKNLETKYPRNPGIQKKFFELFKTTGNNEKLESARLKTQFYSWVPEYCDLDCSEENYNKIEFFIADNSSKDKMTKLKEIIKGDENKAIDLLIAILNVHANHGNGIEEEARKMLTNIGNQVVPKVIKLMENAPSTCTVTFAASILAELKDPRGWQPMVDYLPRMENLPFTIIPPNVPEQIIKFDKEKGLIVLLEWLKNKVAEEKQSSDDPLDELGGIFASSSMYSPLSVYKKEKIKKAAKELNYTDKQIERLLKNIFGNK